MKTIPCFPNYVVTRTGKVWSPRRGIWLQPFTTPKNYKRVTLWNAGSKVNKLVHRLVLEAFVGPCPNGMECCHNNGNPADNRLVNLRWDTTHNNNLDAFKHGVYATKLVECDAIFIHNAYHAETYTGRELADMFRVSRATVSGIVNHKTWRHIKDDPSYITPSTNPMGVR